MNKQNIFKIFLLISLLCCYKMQAKTTTPKNKLFNKVVIWGHKLKYPINTFAYIHHAWDRAFRHLGYETYWFDNDDSIKGINFANTLFITEGQVDQNMPLRHDCFYVIHYGNPRKYQPLFKKGRCIALDRYDADAKKDATPVDSATAYNLSMQTLYIPWATDLLPHEIDKVKKDIQHVTKHNFIWWVGTIGGKKFGNINEINPFKKACKEKKLTFYNRCTGVSMENNVERIQQSYMAPAIVGTWQRGHGYIPCRIFKNISYGQPGATNSKAVYDLFKNDGIEIVYNPDTYQLFYDTEKYIQSMTLEDLYHQMDYVRDNHTYLNRIERLLEFIEMAYEERNP